MEEFQHLVEDGYDVHILSAGYEIYLKYFIREFGLDEGNLEAVRIGFKNGICTGKISGCDLVWTKLDYLNSHFDKKISMLWPTLTDLPVLQWADSAVVVSKKGAFDWAKRYNFREILWE